MRNVSLLYIKDTIDGSPTKGIVMNKLSPENLFVPSQKNVRGILARYNVPLTRFKHATSGIENLTLMVWSERKKYVLRV